MSASLDHLNLLYYASTLLVGLIVLTISIVIYQATRDTTLRHFIYYHSSFTFLATLNVVSSYLKTNVLPEGGTAYSLVRYLENPGALLLVMFTAPLFVHSLGPVANVRTRNLVIGVTSLLLLIANYTLSLFDSAKEWDQARILLKDVIFIATIVYCWSHSRLFLSQDQGCGRETLHRRRIGVIQCLYPWHCLRHFSAGVYQGQDLPRCILLHGGVLHTPFLPESRPRRALWRNQMCPRVDAWEEVFPDIALRERDLSQREVEVVRLLLEGKTYKGIGEGLSISPNTVKTHLRKAYQKLGVKNRLELARLIKTLGPRPS